MYTLSYFTERYKSYNTVELVEIITSPGQYQPIALQAAKQELENRKISPQELEETKETVKQRKEYRSVSRKKMESINKEIAAKTGTALDHFSPLENTIPMVNKLKAMLAIVYSLLFVYEASLLFSPFSLNDLSNSDGRFYFIVNALPTLLLMVALCFFWPGKTIGWTLLIVYIGHSLFSVFASFYTTITSQGENNFFYSPPSIFQILIVGLFFSLSLLTLNRDDIKIFFAANHKMSGPLVIGCMLFLLLYAINFGFL